jgi:glucan phosphoethanolaminetransferase (alkaline phosphatase superfamily)
MHRSLPAAEEVDVPSQIETRDRLAEEAPRPMHGFLAGAGAAVVGAVVFGAAAGLAGCSCKVLVVGAGFLVTAAVRYFGQGSARWFAVVAACWALIGCAAASLLASYYELASRAGVPARDYADGFVGWSQLLKRAFGPAELLWCGAVLVAAWLLSRKPVTAPPPVSAEPGLSTS